jgi:hypothetical protein
MGFQRRREANGSPRPVISSRIRNERLTLLFFIALTGPVQVNPVLLHVLDTQFGVSLTSEELLSHLLRDDEEEPLDPSLLYAELNERAVDVPGFEIKRSATLGNFAFQKMAMVKDLQERATELAAHDVVAAIAGNEEARSLVGAPQQDQDPKELDRVPPENEFIVLDADSSQQCAIANILMGQNAVIHGRPGTGKSQTISNLVATLAATGHRVLFVAEKRAALEVVLKRLREIGLGHLAIDLHGADLSPRKVMQQVADALDKVRNAVPAECEQIHKQLVDRRNRLNQHVQRLHVKREPTGRSVYEMQGKLLRLGAAAGTTTRWRGEELQRLSSETAEKIRDLLVEAAGFESLFLRTDPSPWTGAKLKDGAALQNALDIVCRSNAETFPAFMASLHTIIQQSGLGWPSSIAAARELIALVGAVQTKLGLYSPDIFKQDQCSLLRELASGRSGRLSASWAWLTNSAYRRARQRTRALRMAGPVSVPMLFLELTEIEHQTTQWKKLSQNDSLPCVVAEFVFHQQNCEALFSHVSALAPVLSGKQLEVLAVDELGSLLARLASDSLTAQQIPKLSQIETDLEAAGAGRLVDEIRGKQPNVQLWPLMFQYSWLASTLDAISQSDAEIRGFKGLTHNCYVNEFVHLDEQRITSAAERVRRAHGLRAIEAMNGHPDQQHLIKAEAAKIKRHLPLRKVFAQAADVLTAVCPCWMASPLSVSQLLDGGK